LQAKGLFAWWLDTPSSFGAAAGDLVIVI